MRMSHPQRRTSRPRAAAAVAGIATVAMLAGCASTGAAGDPAETGSADPGSFTYWSMWKEGEPAQVAIAAAIESFTAETGIEVDVQWQGRDVLTKLQPTLSSNPAADLIDRNLLQVESIMVSSGTAGDLAPVLDLELPEGGTVGDVVSDDYLALGQTGDGMQVLLPYSVTSYGLWYDKSQFPDLEAGQSWDEFETVLDGSRELGAPLALDADIAPYSAYWYTNFVVNRLGAGALHEAAGDRSGEAWGEAGYLEAAERVQALADGDYFVDGYDASRFPAIQQKWASREANFLQMGSWIPAETAPNAADGFEYASIPFPEDGVGEQLVAADSFGWAMPSNADDSEAAQQFVAYMYGLDQAQAYADETSFILARDGVTTAETTATAAAALDAADGLYAPDDGVGSDYSDWVTRVYHPLATQLVTGAIDAENFISEMRAQSVAYWESAP